tara:strand:- start:2857 stop:3471 length:615 start_codon:yes stop_codon:yes gene_type:complete
MATYTLNNSAGDIDDALQKVVAVTTTPLDGNQNMVTSGGVKAYVDTEVTSLNTTIANLANTLVGISVSTCFLSRTSGLTSNNSINFGISNDVSGVVGATHQLDRLNTTTMKTPTGGVSIVSVNATLTDPDRNGFEDNYIISLYTDGNLVAKTSTSGSDTYTTYAQLCYSSLMNQDNSITMSVDVLSGAIPTYTVTGSITCVNYQ